LNWYDYGFRNYDPQIGRFPQLDPLADSYSYYTPFQYAGNDPIANVDQDGLEPLPTDVIGKVGEGAGSSSLLGHAAGQTAELVNAGTQSAHWVSTLQSVAVTAKMPAKLATAAVKPLISTTITITVSTLNLVDNVAIGKPPLEQDVSLEQRIRMTLVIHDDMDPDHPLVSGTKVPGARDQLLKDPRGGYFWGWRVQGIEEDNGFWLMFMPLPKGLGLLKDVGKAAEVGAEEGTNIAVKTVMTDEKLITRIAQKAEKAIGGSGGVKGSLKHQYAKKLLDRYQKMFGDRGLETEFPFNNGPGNRGFLDVVKHSTMQIWDYKFGKAVMSTEQYLKYSTNFRNYIIKVIRP